MRRLLSRTAGAAGALVLTASLTACGGGFSAAPPASTETIHRYVALGDGFTAAPYVGGTAQDDGCLRSPEDYPTLVAKALRISDVRDVSCTGATTEAITSPTRAGTGRTDEPAQIDAVAEDTDLVTIGVGIEDRGLLDEMFRVCTAAPCTRKAVTAQAVLADVNALSDSLTAAVRAVQVKAPRAYIVLIGYPQITPQTGSCPALPKLDQTGLEAANYMLGAVNHQVESAARATGSGFLDVAQLTTGHELCSGDPWVQGHVGKAGESVAYHPLAAEQQAVAKALATIVRNH